MRRSDVAGAAPRRAVLVAGVPPCTNYSGGLFLEEMVHAGSIPVVGAFAVQNPALSPQISERTRRMLRIETVEKPKEWHDPPADAEVVRAAEKAAAEQVPELAERLVRFAETLDATDFWVVLEGQTLIRLAALLLDEGRSVRVQVTDPPGWWFRAQNVDPETTKETLALYDAVMSRARACAAASWSMAERYGARYGLPAIPTLPSISLDLARAPGTARDSGPIRMALAGQRYASAEFGVALRAVEATASDPRPLELHLYPGGGEAIPGVVQHPWLGIGELLPELSRQDLLYCPYWFDPDFREESDLCFPSKLTTYLAAGRPVLFHGRADSSPGRFLRSGAAAFFCFRADVDALVHSIREAVRWRDRYEERARRGRAWLLRYLSTENLGRAVDEFLTV